MADTRPIVVAPLQGVDQRWPANAPSAHVVTDMWFANRGALQSAGGYMTICRGPSNGEGGFTSPFASVGPIESIHWFVQHTGARRWLIYIDGNGQLIAYNPSTAARAASPGDVCYLRDGTAITRTVIPTPWQRSQSACWGDQFYMVNGVDRPLVFNGYYWDYAGWNSAPGAPTAVTMNHPHASDSGGLPGTGVGMNIPNTGLGPMDESTTDAANYKCSYKYRIAYINDRGAVSPWSEASETAYFINLGDPTSSPGHAPHFVRVSWSPGPASTVAVIVARTQNLYDSSNTLIVGRDQQFYTLGTVQDNATCTFMDSTPDGLLGGLVDTTAANTYPSGARLIKSFKGRMYVAGTDNASIYYSNRNQPETFGIGNRLPVGGDTLGPVTGMYATRNTLVVFKARKTYLVEDDGVNEPVILPLDGTIGCVAPNTIQEIPSVGIFFLSEGGIGLLIGTLQNEGAHTEILNAAVELPNEFRNINRSAIINACSAVYHRDKEYWLAIPTLGAPNNRQTLVYHYEQRMWTMRPYYPIASMLETPDTNGDLLFASYASTPESSPDGVAHKGIFVYTRGAVDKDGTTITPVYETNQIGIGQQFRAFRPHNILVNNIGHGNNALNINIATNFSLTNWMAKAIPVTQQYPMELAPVYGTAVYDKDAVWQEWHPITVRADLDKPTAGPVLVAAIRLTPESGTRYMTLFAMSLEVAPEDPVKALPLKPTGS